MKTLAATLYKVANDEQFTPEKRRGIILAVLEEHMAKHKK